MSYQTLLTAGCAEGLQRDLWFRFLQPNINISSVACSVNIIAFNSFLILYILIFGVAIFLSFLAAIFQSKRVPRIQLLVVSIHSSYGLAICVGSLVRDDFHAMGNPGFWICFAMFVSFVLAHSLLMTDTIKTLSLKTAPRSISNNMPLVKQLTASTLAQKIALGIAGLQTVLVLVAFMLIIFARTSSTLFWDQDPEFWTRKEFLFCIGCLLCTTTTATFIAVPVRHTHRMWRFCKEMRERTKQMIRPPSPRGSKLGDAKKTNAAAQLVAVEEREGEDVTVNFAAGEIQKHDSSSDVDMENTPRQPVKRNNSAGSEAADSIPHPSRLTRLGSSLRSLSDSVPQLVKSESSRSVVKRRATVIEVQRHSMLVFQHKMLQATILGWIVGTWSVIITILMSDSRLVGPVTPIVFVCLGSPFFLQFFVINLYFPENLLHERFVKMLPVWLQERIDGVPTVDEHTANRDTGGSAMSSVVPGAVAQQKKN